MKAKNAKLKEKKCEGTVDIVSAKKCMVKLNKKPECDDCGMCKHNLNAQANIIAENSVNAGIGDEVIVEAKKKSFDLVIKIMYFLPIIALLVGFICATTLEEEIYQLIFALCTFVAGLILVAIILLILRACSKTKYCVTQIIKAAERVEMTVENEKSQSEQQDNTQDYEQQLDESNSNVSEDNTAENQVITQ